MSSEARLARLGLSHLADDPDALDAVLLRKIIEHEISVAEWGQSVGRKSNLLDGMPLEPAHTPEAREARIQKEIARRRAIRRFESTLTPPAPTAPILVAVIEDPRSGLIAELYLGEPRQVWRRPLTFGSAADNHVVITLDGVAPHACEMLEASWVDGAPFSIGPIRVTLVTRPYRLGDPTTRIPLPLRLSYKPDWPCLQARPQPTWKMSQTARFIHSIAQVRWLVPDAALDALEPAACAAIVSALADHHLAFGRPTIIANDVAFMRSPAEVRRAFVASWAEISPGDDAATMHLRALGAEHSDADPALTALLDGALGATSSDPSLAALGLTASRAPWYGWADRVARRLLSGQPHPGLDAIGKIFCAGAWPVILPRDRWIVWVPRRQGEHLEVDTGGSVPSLPPVLDAHHDVAAWLFAP